MGETNQPDNTVFPERVMEIAQAQEDLETMVKQNLGGTALGGPDEVLHEGDHASLTQNKEGLVVEINQLAPDEGV